MDFRRSNLEDLCRPDAFLWATGIEDTFISHPWPATGRTLDEYALTGHYERWRDDIGLIARLGVSAARYGIPWYRVNPAPGRWDWTWTDGPLEALLARGIAPIVDLVHYGTPDWLEGSFLNPDYPERVAEYAARVAERYRGRIHAYTPLNEPRVNAWFCGRIGWWPPYLRGMRGFLDVLLPLCRGIVRTAQALRSVDPEITLIHVDATDLYETDDPTLAADCLERQELVFLALDLVSGRVTGDHALAPWLRRKRIPAPDIDWFQENTAPLDVVGINLYPMFSRKRLVRTPSGVRLRLPYANPAFVETLAGMYWERYHRPLMVTETAANGSVARRLAWLAGSVESVRGARAQGIPVVGYTWWPLFALIGWAYRQKERDLAAYLVQMGLWDLDPATLDRVPTPLVEAYRALTTGGLSAVGPLA